MQTGVSYRRRRQVKEGADRWYRVSFVHQNNNKNYQNWFDLTTPAYLSLVYLKIWYDLTIRSSQAICHREVNVSSYISQYQVLRDNKNFFILLPFKQRFFSTSVGTFSYGWRLFVHKRPLFIELNEQEQHRVLEQQQDGVNKREQHRVSEQEQHRSSGQEQHVVQSIVVYVVRDVK